MKINLFQNRNPRAANLIKLGDCLGRSLRQNVELFSVDDDSAVYLTEDNHIIKGKVVDKVGVGLKDIVVEEADVFKDNKSFEALLEKKVRGVIGSIHSDKYESAMGGFQNLLSLFESRVKFSSTVASLEEKCERLEGNNNILDTDEVSKLKEIVPSLSKFLKENKSKLDTIPEIMNAVKLSNIISQAFDLPRKTVEDLSESGSCFYPDNHSSTIYDMVCRQELVKKELLESKRSFKNIWATSSAFNKLSSTINSKESEVIQALAEAIAEVPYIAFATKMQISDTIQEALAFDDGEVASTKEIRDFTAKIFELKKPVKNHMIKLLTEKYGINFQNLKEVPSFKNLLNTQVVVFEALARLSDKGSVQRQVLSETSEMLKTKSGVESIDINNLLCEIFTDAGYDTIEETSLSNYIDYHAVADDLGKIGDVLRLLKQSAAGMPDGGQMGMDPGMGAPEPGMDPGMGMEPPMPPEAPELGQENPPMGGEEMPQADGIETPGVESDPMMDPQQAAGDALGSVEQDFGEDPMGDPDQDGIPNGEEMKGQEMVPGEEGELPPDGDGDGIPGEEDLPGMEGEEAPDDEDIEVAPQEFDKDELMTNIAEIEDLLADLTAELEMGDGPPGGEELGGEEEGMPPEGGPEVPGDVDGDGESDIPDEEEEEGDFPPKGKDKKKKPFPKKGE